MKGKILSLLVALCLLVPATPEAHASSKDLTTQKDFPVQQDISTIERTNLEIPTPAAAYSKMIAMQKDYPEGMDWTDQSSGTYEWKGGRGEHGEILTKGTGCVNFAFRLSDAVFGSLPARMLNAGTFQFEDINVGDILRVKNNTHSVIVLQVNEDSVVIAEGNYNKSIHWGRVLTKVEVLASNHVLTRYPKGYKPSDDSTANEMIAGGTLESGLSWRLIKAGTLTVSGSGIIPDFNFGGSKDSRISDRPWNEHISKIQKIVIEDGITGIGTNAFRECNAYNVSIPASVATIGKDAFRECANITFVTPDGVRTIGERAFQGCTNLRGVTLPDSVETVGSGAFFDCTELRIAKFLPSESHVTMGENIFSRCWYLADVTLPQKMDQIGKEMFLSCLMLPEIIIPEGVESIGVSSFSNCSRLQSIFIPKSVNSIGLAAFANCGLTDVYFGGSEAEWEKINKIGDTATILAKLNIHYNTMGAELPPSELIPPLEPTSTPVNIQASGITLNQNSIVIGKEKTSTLRATIIPENATNMAVAWSSSNMAVAIVNEKGVVKGVKGGTAVITATTANGISATCKVTVATLTLNVTKITLQKGKTTTAVKIKKATDGDNVKSWKSSKPSVATVTNSGKIKAIKNGTATITITMKSGAIATCKVTVQSKQVTAASIKMNKKTWKLKKGKSATLSVIINPVTATDLKWKSSNSKVVSVNKKGKVTAKKAGTATITVTISNGKKVTCKITVI